MAIRKKGSRLIEVDGQRYRWRIRPRPTYDQECFACELTVSVEAAEEAGAVLVALLDGVRPDAAFGRTVVVTPSSVALLIREALAAGWRPMTPGDQFLFRAAPLSG